MTMAINNITLSGYLGADCVERCTPNDKLVATFPLAVKQGYGEHQKTSWVQCRLFGLHAKKLPMYLTRGTKVTVTGAFLLENWTDKSETKRTRAVVIVKALDFFSKKDNQSQDHQSLKNCKESITKNPLYDNEIPF